MWGMCSDQTRIMIICCVQILPNVPIQNLLAFLPKHLLTLVYDPFCLVMQKLPIEACFLAQSSGGQLSIQFDLVHEGAQIRPSQKIRTHVFFNLSAINYRTAVTICIWGGEWLAHDDPPLSTSSCCTLSLTFIQIRLQWNLSGSKRVKDTFHRWP